MDTKKIKGFTTTLFIFTLCCALSLFTVIPAKAAEVFLTLQNSRFSTLDDTPLTEAELVPGIPFKWEVDWAIDQPILGGETFDFSLPAEIKYAYQAFANFKLYSAGGAEIASCDYEDQHKIVCQLGSDPFAKANGTLWVAVTFVTDEEKVFSVESSGNNILEIDLSDYVVDNNNHNVPSSLSKSGRIRPGADGKWRGYWDVYLPISSGTSTLTDKIVTDTSTVSTYFTEETDWIHLFKYKIDENGMYNLADRINLTNSDGTIQGGYAETFSYQLGISGDLPVQLGGDFAGQIGYTSISMTIGNMDPEYMYQVFYKTAIPEALGTGDVIGNSAEFGKWKTSVTTKVGASGGGSAEGTPLDSNVTPTPTPTVTPTPTPTGPSATPSSSSPSTPAASNPADTPQKTYNNDTATETTLAKTGSVASVIATLAGVLLLLGVGSLIAQRQRSHE